MIYSAATKTVVYNTTAPQFIIDATSGSKMVGEYAAVPHNIKNMQVMRRLGYEAFSPILTEYDWSRNPHKVPHPFNHQKQLAAFMTLHPRCFNLSDMGTGKTLATLWALDYLMTTGVIERALILSPLSTLYRTWEDEVFTHFLGKRKAVVLHGSRERRIETYKRTDADFLIINHDGVGVGGEKSNRGYKLGLLGECLRNDKSIGAVVVDEGSVYKDSSTTRYKAMRQLIEHKDYVYWLTGTPTPVDPTNAWAQARAVRRDYTESFRGFQERTMKRLTTFKMVPKEEGMALAAQILQPAIRFGRDECLDLPDVMIETLDVELSANQKKAFKDMKDSLSTQLGSGTISAINEAVLRTKLIQIACGAVYGEEREVHRVDCAPRLQVLEEIIERSSHKIIIFAPLTSVVNMLHNELRRHYTVEKVTGAVSAKARNDIFRDFQNSPDPRIIVADPGTMAHGLTLTAAATTIWFGPTDKPEIYQQANKRMDRPGQKHSMLIVRLCATGIEREIFKRLDNREKMQGVVLNLIKEG